METLKNLLSVVPNNDYPKWFEYIAMLLFNNYAIKTDSNTYRITEIEFYYHHEDHQDLTTYGYIDKSKTYLDRIRRHKEAQYKSLTWFFHYSGVDLVIGNENAPGGVLIRAIENNETGEKVVGPLVVLLELLNQQISVDGKKSLMLELVLYEYEKNDNISTKERVGLGASADGKRKYNFSIATRPHSTVSNLTTQ